MVVCVQVLLALWGMTVYHQEHTPSASWQELQMARGKLKGGKFTLVGMGWKHLVYIYIPHDKYLLYCTNFIIIMDEPCVFEQAMNHISLTKSRPTCYAKSSMVLDAFQLIPSLISCAGWPGGEDCYLMYKCSQVADLIHAVGRSSLNVAAFHAAVLQNLYCYYHVLLSVHIYVHTQAPKVPVPWHYCILWYITVKTCILFYRQRCIILCCAPHQWWCSGERVWCLYSVPWQQKCALLPLQVGWWQLLSMWEK